MKRNTKLIGITGNIGTGKSTVAWMFEELGVPVLDADEIAHDVIKPKTAAWKAIYKRYGAVIILSDNVINRKNLARIIFQDPVERKFLESVIHPHVKEEIERRVIKLSKEGAPFVMVEVPLLFEAGWENEFDAVIVVRCSEAEEIERCMKKFGFDREEVLLRLGSQYPLARKIENADYVIDNSGTVDETRVQVKRLFQNMLKGKFPEG